MADDRADFEGRLKETQSKMRQDAAEALAKVQKAEEEARDAKGRAWTSQTELSNAQSLVEDSARANRELTVRVEELRSELSKADSAVEEARRLSKDRLTAMQREHDRVLNKIEETNNDRVREATGQRDKSLAEKRVLEAKVEEVRCSVLRSRQHLESSLKPSIQPSCDSLRSSQLEDECTRIRTDLHGAKLRMR